MIRHSVFATNIFVEDDFIDKSISSDMKQYIEHISDRLLLMIGLEKVYYVENPFPWMELISVQGKTNFFEKRVGEYANIANSNTQENVFSIDGDF